MAMLRGTTLSLLVNTRFVSTLVYRGPSRDIRSSREARDRMASKAESKRMIVDGVTEDEVPHLVRHPRHIEHPPTKVTVSPTIQVYLESVLSPCINLLWPDIDSLKEKQPTAFLDFLGTHYPP
ncbi:hypothetical protein Fot_21609 [Forsythia ovata]|uniref:Uncharacterized protein n=1 Tax=Forsythia ovata TaxID=205694 RepID=A0ABD1UX78_9LAMI